MYQPGKFQCIQREASRLKIYIISLAKVRWTKSAKLTTYDNVMVYSGHQKEHKNGVGVLLTKQVAMSMVGFHALSDRILILKVFDLSLSGRSFICPVGTQLFDMSWLGGSYSTFPDRDIALQHAPIRTQFYDIPWSGRSFITCPGCDAIVRYACSGHNLTTCHGWDTAL